MKFVTLLLLMLGQCAYAANWTLVGDNGIGAFYIDKASTAPSNGVLQTQTLLNWSEPHPLLGNDQKYYTSEIATTYLDCHDKSMAFGSRTMYAGANGTGNIMFSIELKFGELQLRNFLAGSTGARLMQFVCSK